MGVSYSKRVEFGSDHIIDRLGTSIRYYRFESQTWDPNVGPVKTWYESPTFNALVVSVTSEEIRDGGGIISIGDRSFLFKIAEFTDQGGDDTVCPVAGDEIVYGGNTYEVDLGGNEVIYEADVADTLFLVYARRKV